MSDKPAQPPPGGAASDPSMEDILASIRRILSEDEPPPGEASAAVEHGTPPAIHAAEHAPAAPLAPEPAQKDVLVLHPSMMVAEPEPPPASEPRMASTEPPRDPAPAGAPSESGLVAPAAAAAAASSVGALVRTLNERSAQVHRGGNPTIEDIVRDEIRPILKDWLDHNLPPIVERLVRLEIERVVGRAVL